MKIQDILFSILFIALLFARKPKMFAYFGLVTLLAAIPLYGKWIFFTAERFIWYGAFLLFTAVVWLLLQERKVL